MLKETGNLVILDPAAAMAEGIIEFRHQKEFLIKRTLQNAVLNSTHFSSIVTDEKGVIQIFNVGAERMLGYEVIARAKALSIELETMIPPGFKALAFNTSRGIEDIYELSCIRNDGSRFPAIVSATTLRNTQNEIIGYLLIGTYNTARKRQNKVLLKVEAMKGAIFPRHQFLEDGFMADYNKSDSHLTKGRSQP